MRSYVRLLIKNNKNEFLVLKEQAIEGWHLPGGKVEENEKPDVAAIRELKEELDLNVKNLNLILNGIFDFPKGERAGFYYLCEVENINDLKIMEPEKLVDLTFCEFDKIKNLDMPEKIIKMLKEVL